MKADLIMQEYAARDKRSIAAMLNRRGDGREKQWLKFEQVHQAQMSQEEKHAAFELASRYRKVIHWDVLLSKTKKGLFIVLGVPFYSGLAQSTFLQN